MGATAAAPSQRAARAIPRARTGLVSRATPLLMIAAMAALAFAFDFATASLSAASVINSKHNLSANGPGTIRATTESDTCLFCHTVHHAGQEAPLWNRTSSGATYTPYASSTMKATVGQPTGSSKVCLSCHDGTIALGLVRSRSTQIEFVNNVTTLPAGKSRLGTDLSDDHPISFTYDSALVAANGELTDPSALHREVKLDKNHQLQCTTCHDAHNDQFGKFLVMDNAGSALCTECHGKARWQASSHRNSTAIWNGQAPNPWPHTSGTTVAANGCENCHAPHNAGTKPRLLNQAGEEQNCYTCHNGHVATSDVQSEFSKSSIHPVQLTTGVHDPAENPLNPPRHVECEDCHNPHASKAQLATAPAVNGSLAGVRGINVAGNLIAPALNEYEVCFRCHSDGVPGNPATITRQNPQTNTRIQFAGSNQSFHPVTAARNNPNVPSLKPTLTATTIIYCTDCHNSDSGPGAGGSGPKGPHGSRFSPLLERNMTFTDNMGETPDAYALCYKCHDRDSILNDKSFQSHNKHVVTCQTACSTCHDSHGVPAAGGLINFNTFYVKPSTANGRLEYIRGANFAATCSLICHGKDHDALSTPAAP